MNNKKTVIFDDREWFEPIDLDALLKEVDEEETIEKGEAEEK